MYPTIIERIKFWTNLLNRRFSIRLVHSAFCFTTLVSSWTQLSITNSICTKLFTTNNRLLFSYQVTLIQKLEQFGIDPSHFAHQMQLAAASSTTGNSVCKASSFTAASQIRFLHVRKWSEVFSPFNLAGIAE